MSPEKLARLLTCLGGAADVVKAIDNPGLQGERGWDLADWRYAPIPGGGRFRHYDGREEVDAEVVAVRVGDPRPDPVPVILPTSRRIRKFIVLE